MTEDRTLIYLSILLEAFAELKVYNGEEKEKDYFTDRTHNLLRGKEAALEKFGGSDLVSIATQLVSSESISKRQDNALLKPVFQTVSLGDTFLSEEDEYWYQLKKLEIGPSSESSSVFPFSGVRDGTQIQEDAKTLWGDLLSEHEKLKKASNLEAYSESLYYLLQKFGARVAPKANYSTGDVSLFDHYRLIGAVVNCLSLPGQSIEDPEFVLLIGDLSGLQKFIYSNIDPSEAGSTRGLARKLRGRSFFIALLTELIAEEMVRAFDVNKANILYAGGGGFQVLLPVVPDYHARIREFESKINQFLFKKIEGRIGLVSGHVVAGGDLFSNPTPYIQKTYDFLGKEKVRKFKPNLPFLFFERPLGEEGQFFDDKRLGELIPYGKLLLEIEVTSGQPLTVKENLEPHSALKGLDRYLFILDERKNRKDLVSDLSRHLEAYKDQAATIRLVTINNTDFLDIAEVLQGRFPDLDIRPKFKFIGSFAPTRSIRGSDAVLEYKDIARLNNLPEEQGTDLSYPKLAVMRLDVDNLGALFAIGLGTQASFPRVATMSRELDLFFSGYFNRIAEKFSLYVTYSGGDDAFVVGSWLNVMHGALELYEKFREFTCFNPAMTFSAGIFMCDEHYPVAKFAKAAEEAENRAKAFNAGEKNAVCVFDHVLSWTQYRELIGFAQTILEYVNQDGESDRRKLSRSFIHRILQIVKSCISEDGQLDGYRLQRQSSRLHYLFARQELKGNEKGFTAEVLKKAETKAVQGENMDMAERIAHHVIRIFLDYFRNRDDKKGLLGNLIVPTSYVTLKTRKLENR